MKKLLVAVAAVLITAVSHGQGTFDFNNTGTGQGIWLPGQVGVEGPGAAGSLQLYYNGTAVLAAPLTFFDLEGATHWAQLPPTITVAGATPGTTGTIEVRVWETSFGSWDAARVGGGFYSDSATQDWTFTTTFGGPDPAGGPPFTAGTSADFVNGTTGFELSVVPEPSTIALGVIGAAALLLRRRRK